MAVAQVVYAVFFKHLKRQGLDGENKFLSDFFYTDVCTDIL